jgi:uncharacterized protein YigA (DUF484 family)
MTDAQTQTDEPSMDKQTLITFLQENPNFLQENPDVVELLIPPKKRAVRGQPADFQSYMIERLKADKAEVTETARELIENSRANMNNQTRIHEAILRLLEAKKFDEFIHTLTMDLPTMLDVDIATLVVESDGDNIPQIQTSGIRILPPSTVDSWMNGLTVIQESDITGIEAIYGGGATLVKSQILLRIDIAMETPPAILAFGSRDPHMFSADQATDQILFLARVIERCFRSWLSLPV